MNNASQALTLCDYVAMALLALVAGVELWSVCLAMIDRRRSARTVFVPTAKDETQETKALLDKLDREPAARL